MIPVCYIQNNAPHRRKTAIESSKISPRDGPQNNKNAGFLEKNREKQGRTGETGAHQTVSSASQSVSPRRDLRVWRNPRYSGQVSTNRRRFSWARPRKRNWRDFEG